MRKYFFLLLTSFSFALTAQEVQSDSLAGNPVLIEYYKSRSVQQASLRSQMSIPDTLNLPFHDNFFYAQFTPDTSLWADDSAMVYVNRTYPTAPVNIGVATFDGCNAHGYPYNVVAPGGGTGNADRLTSKPLDLTGSPADSVYLSFYYEAMGLGNAPEAIDSLILEYKLPSETDWRYIWSEAGYTPSATDTGFHRVMLRLDSASYFVRGFQFRFRNTATLSGNLDHWHLDEVYLAKNRSINDTIIGDVAFVYQPPRVLSSYHAVPAWHYSASMITDSLRTNFIRNNDDLVRNITYKYRVLDRSGNLQFEYPNASGAADNLSPFETSGYEQMASLRRPPFAAFSGFSAFPAMAGPSDTTYFDVQHILKETAVKFDTVTYRQKFYNYYAYDDGSAEASYGLNVLGGMIAYQFNSPVNDTLEAVQMYFNPVPNTNSTVSTIDGVTFSLAVWSHNSSTGGPGTLVYAQNSYTPEYLRTPNRYMTYTIDSGIVIVGGTFYVGWIQNSPERMNVGVDKNSQVNGKQFFNINGSWQSSIFSDAWMIRPVFRHAYETSTTGIAEQSQAAVQLGVQPNPATESVNIRMQGFSADAQVNYALVDLSGRCLFSEQGSNQMVLDVSMLPAGLYFIRATDKTSGLQLTQKLVKQ